MKPKDTSSKQPLWVLGGKLCQTLLVLLLGNAALLQAPLSWAEAAVSRIAKPPYNIVFIIVDQMTYRLAAFSRLWMS